jgi:archaetidylinositol phosphate synthase
MQQDESLLIMLPQRHRKFTRDAGSSLHSAGFVQETNSPGKPPPLAIRSPLAIRVKDNILAQAERDLLDWLCARTPDAITPDRLTGFGAAGAAVVFLGYAATPFHPAFFWLATLGLLMHWFGDSLDGSLARYRRIERPRYGHFLDFSVDVISSLMIMLGVGLSAYVRLDVALFALVGYYMLWLFVLLNCQVSRNLQLSFLAAGPTEFRLVLIGLNCWMYFGGNLKMPIGSAEFSPYELAFCGMGIVSMGLFAVNVFNVARQLRVEDAVPKQPGRF